MLSLSYWPNQPLTWIELTLAVMPACSISLTMRCTALSGSGGTSSQKSIARSYKRQNWSEASAQPGTSRRTVSRTSAMRAAFDARTDASKTCRLMSLRAAAAYQK